MVENVTQLNADRTVTVGAAIPKEKIISWGISIENQNSKSGLFKGNKLGLVDVEHLPVFRECHNIGVQPRNLLPPIPPFPPALKEMIFGSENPFHLNPIPLPTAVFATLSISSLSLLPTSYLLVRMAFSRFY